MSSRSEMNSAKKGGTFSLSESVRYQNALRTNGLENIRMLQKMRKLNNDETMRTMSYIQTHKNIFEWAQAMKTTTGTTFHEDPDKLFRTEEKKKEDDDVAPSYYFAYGMRIGERPQLLKNFLGIKQRRKRKKINDQSRLPLRRATTAPADTENISEEDADNQKIIHSYFLNKSLEREAHKSIRRGYKTFMFENKIITQVPIGYSRECTRPNTCFSSSSSEQLKPENTVLPSYYFMKYHGLLPPVNMFR